MYNAGIVGCGVIGERFADAFADHDRTVLRAACDRIEERADTFAESYGCDAYTDHERLLSDDAIDLVHVGVPPIHHREVVADALAAGKHVICEKPIAADADTGAEMVELAADADVVTAMDLPFRYTPGFVEMRRRIEDGDVGTPKRINLEFRFPQWPREWQDVDWLRSRDQGGPLREIGTHFLFGVQELFGPIGWVSAAVEFTGPDAYESSIVGYFEADGVHGTLDLVCDHAGVETNAITVIGEDSSLSLTDWHRLRERWRTDDERILNEQRASTPALLIDEFVTELDGGDGDLVGFAEANRVQRVVDAVFASGGERISLSE